MNYETRMIPLASILVSARIRKDTGDIRELAADMEKHGMLNPITVMDAQNGQYLMPMETLSRILCRWRSTQER